MLGVREPPSDTETIITYWVVLALATGALVYAYFRFKLLQKMRNLATSKVRSAAVGTVELIGRARPADGLLTSPLGGRPCFYWKVTYEVFKRKHRRWGWVFVGLTTSHNDFYLEDATGKILVKSASAEMRDLPASFTSKGKLDKSLAQVASDYAHNCLSAKEQSELSGRRVRVKEHCLSDGDPIYVLGRAAPIPMASSALAHANLMIHKASKQSLIIGYGDEKTVGRSLRREIILIVIVALFFGITSILELVGSDWLKP